MADNFADLLLLFAGDPPGAGDAGEDEGHAGAGAAAAAAPAAAAAAVESDEGEDEDDAAEVGDDIAARARALSDRSKTARLAFIQDAANPDFWTCNVETDAATGHKCGIRVKQSRRNESNNLIAHLVSKHKRVVSVPAARKRTAKRAREAAATVVADAAAVVAQPPAAAQAAAARNAEAMAEEVVDLFVRRSLPFALADDPFFAKLFGGGRHGMARRIVDGAAAKLAALKRALAGVEVAVISDAGTHHGRQSVDVVVQAHGIPTAVAVVYPADTTAQTLQGHLQEVAAGFRVIAFISDNASNFVAAGLALADINRCFQSSCGAHAVQIAVRNLVIPAHREAIADVDTLRDAVRRVKELKKIPVEVDTRWNTTFLALQFASKNWPAYFQRGLLTDEARLRIDAAVAALQPAYDVMLEVESDRATTFNNVSAVTRMLLPAIGGDDEAEAYRIFFRDFCSLPFIAAVIINPALKWPTLPKWAVETLVQSLASAIEIATRCGIDVARGHARTWAGGQMQSHWDLSDTTANEFFAKPPRAAAHVKQLFDKLLKIPASSAAVERAFSTHTAIHSDARASLQHDGVESSLVFRSIKARERAEPAEPLVPRFPDTEKARVLAMWCARVAAHRAVANAPLGTRVTVYFERRGGGYDEHVGTIAEKLSASTVKMRWAGGAPSAVDFTVGDIFVGVAN